MSTMDEDEWGALRQDKQQILGWRISYQDCKMVPTSIWGSYSRGNTPGHINPRWHIGGCLGICGLVVTTVPPLSLLWNLCK